MGIRIENPFDSNNDIVNTDKSGVDQLIDIAANVITGGLVGYKDGKINKGVGLRAIDEGVGELTGRNVARKEAMNNKDLLDAEKANRLQEQKDEQARRQRDDVAASNAAGSANAVLGSDLAAQATQLLSKDFLGI